MRRLLPVFVLVLAACVAEPPERTPLPDLEDVLPEPVGCQLNVGSPLGVNVESVIEGGAASGILQEDDLIVAIEGEPTPDRPTLSEVKLNYGPGDTIEIGFMREGVADSALVTLVASGVDPTRGVIGITVQTAFDQVSPEDTGTTVSPSPTARPIEVGGTIHLLDPLVNSWQETGIGAPEDTRWVSTSSGLYAVTDTEPIEIVDMFTDETIADDGFEGWEAQRLIGTVDDLILVVVTTDVADQPGFVNLAIAGFDPRSGVTQWVQPASTTLGIPVAAYGSPDGTLFLTVGADPDTGERSGVSIYDAAGNLQDSDGLGDLGDPIGWFDETSVAFRTSDTVVTVLNLLDGSSEPFDLPESLSGSVTAAVGDGQSILIVGGRDLLIQDLTDPNYSIPLADNCTIGLTGDPGWGT